MFNYVATAQAQDSAELTLVQEPWQMLGCPDLLPQAADTRYVIVRQISETAAGFFLRAIRKARGFVRASGRLTRITYVMPTGKAELLEAEVLTRRWASSLSRLIQPNAVLVIFAPAWARVEVLQMIESLRTELAGISLVAKFTEENAPEPVAARTPWQHAIT
jgi:hypothetical protein